jgi:septal ring factor EnvC (AmiA/AmiB activator)
LRSNSFEFFTFLGLSKLKAEIAVKEKELSHLTTRIDVTNDDLLNAQAEAHRVDIELQALDKQKETASAQVDDLKALVFALGKLNLNVSLTYV